VPEVAIDGFRRIAAAVETGPDHRLSLRMLASPWRAVALSRIRSRKKRPGPARISR